MTLDRYQSILASTGGAAEPLSDRERRDWLRTWRETYAAGLHAATGRWKHGPFEWHVFSFEHARALNGERAAAAYAAERPSVVVVCPESPLLPVVRLTGGALPDFRTEREDVYVGPEDLAWTMAFTHEESLGLGPYFCRRDWVVAEPRSLPRRRRRARG